jgi:hypothetical protein
MPGDWRQRLVALLSSRTKDARPIRLPGSRIALTGREQMYIIGCV